MYMHAAWAAVRTEGKMTYKGKTACSSHRQYMKQTVKRAMKNKGKDIKRVEGKEERKKNPQNMKTERKMATVHNDVRIELVSI